MSDQNKQRDYQQHLEKLLETRSQQLDQLSQQVKSDRSRIEELEKQIAELTKRDAATGLLRHDILGEFLDVGIARSERNRTALALFYIGIDNLAGIDKLYGKEGVDFICQAFAQRLSATLRKNDVAFVANRGEYILLVEDVYSTDEVNAIANKVLQFSETPYVVNGLEITVSACVGVAVYPLAGENAAELTANADSTLLRARELGASQYLIYSSDAPLNS